MTASGDWYGPAGWFTLALVNAGLAQSKNRSRIRWFVVSLFLGPLATALIVVWPAPAAPPEGWNLHPVRRVRDRWLLLVTFGLVFFVLGGLLAVGAVHSEPDFGILVGLSALGLAALVAGSVGYNRADR